MDRSLSEIAFGIWSAYLSKVKVRAHQKVQLNYELSQVSLCAKSYILNIQFHEAWLNFHVKEGFF